MNLPKLILVVVDSTMRQTAATHRAVELARRARARLHLCMVAFDPRIDATAELVHPDVERLARERFLEVRLRWLAQWTAELAAQNLAATCEVMWARSEHEALLARVLEMSPDLVVKDLAHESFLRRWSVVRSADSRFARMCPAPLMLVQADAPVLPTRIAVAVDPAHPHARATELDERIVQIALPLALAANATLELVHVFPYSRSEEGMSAKLDELIEQMRREDATAFGKFADRYSVPEDRRVLLGGNPIQELLTRVEARGIGLIVLGSPYRGGLDRFMLGSTVEALIAQASCDLLLVRPDGFAAELARHQDLGALQARYGERALV